MIRLTVLGSGSSGNCAVVATDETVLLLDAGLSARQIVLRLEQIGLSLESLNGVLLTHEHGDHTRGLDIICRKKPLPVVCTALTRESLSRDSLFRAPPPFHIMQTGGAFQFRDLTIESFPVPHDAVDPVGFVIEDNESRLGVLSDVGHVTHLIRDRLQRAHSLFLEANYDSKLLELDTRRPWATKQRISSRHGHLSNEQVAELVEAVAHDSLHHVMLGHLSDDCNDPAVAIRHVRQALDRAGLREVSVACAERHQPTPTIAVARRTLAEAAA